MLGVGAEIELFFLGFTLKPVLLLDNWTFAPSITLWVPVMHDIIKQKTCSKPVYMVIYDCQT